jgi:DNA-binding transcriptional ArsR family regulator
VDRLFRALASRHRRALLDALYAQPGQSLTALCEGHKMSRQSLTRHLSVLEKAGLVVAQRSGREKLHYLNPVPLRRIHDRWLRKFDAQASDILLGIKHGLERRPHLVKK